MDGGASSPATATPCGKRIRFPAEILLIGSSRGLRPSRAHPEAEGTDSPPHHPFSDSAEILRISGRGICKEAIFSPGASPRSEKISTRGDQPKIFDFAWSVAKRLACPKGKQPFRRAGRRPRLEVEKVHTLSRSPGAVLMEILVSGEAGCSFVGVVSDDASVGRSAPLHPLGGRGREGCDPLALSRGWSGGEFGFRRCRAVLLTAFVSDDAGTVLLRFFVPDDAGVGRSAPLHPLGRRVREGYNPLALSRG